MDYSLTGSCVHGILQARILGLWSSHSQGIFPTQRMNPGPLLSGGFFPSEPPGKPRNTGLGSLSLLQGICLTQES